jgi:hypothetical protein
MNSEMLMPRPKTFPKSDLQGPVDGRDRLEIIRFTSTEERQQAIGALIDYGMLNFTSYSQDEWLVRTPIARKLRELGVPFEWLTENS